MAVRIGQAGHSRLNGYQGPSYLLRGHISQCSMEIVTGNATEIKPVVCWVFFVLVRLCLFLYIYNYVLIDVFVTFHE